MNLKHKTQNIQKLKHAKSISDNMLATDLHDLIYGYLLPKNLLISPYFSLIFVNFL